MPFFDAIPSVTLYHYTSLSALLNIVDEQMLRATHIAHLTDASELQYAGDILQECIRQRSESCEPAIKPFLTQLTEWVEIGGYLEQPLFTCSFSEDGNLLSQWQTYCPPSNGVSLGFNPESLLSNADHQGFQLTKCVYNLTDQHRLIDEWLDEVIAMRDDVGEWRAHQHPTQSYHGYFRRHQTSLLSIAARLKHPAFSAEREWRLISRPNPDLRNPAIKFRASSSRIVPFVNFRLPETQEGNLSLNGIYTGPAMEHNLSFSSLSMFFTNKNVSFSHGIRASGIPLRNW